MIKAIETKYNGYRFRSRLEARVAVFLDDQGQKYEYEPEGFELSSGWYLPDFWMPEWKAWLEVKPEGGITEKSLKLAEELCEESGYAVLILDGLPKIDKWDGMIYYLEREITDEKKYFEHIRRFIKLQKSGLDLMERYDEFYDKYSSYLTKEAHKEMVNGLNLIGEPYITHDKFMFSRYPEGCNDFWVVISQFDTNCFMVRKAEEQKWKSIEEDEYSVDYPVQFRDYFVEKYEYRSPFVHYDGNDYDFIIEALDQDSWSMQCILQSINKAKSARFEHGECG